MRAFDVLAKGGVGHPQLHAAALPSRDDAAAVDSTCASWCRSSDLDRRPRERSRRHARAAAPVAGHAGRRGPPASGNALRQLTGRPRPVDASPAPGRPRRASARRGRTPCRAEAAPDESSTAKAGRNDCRSARRCRRESPADRSSRTRSVDEVRKAEEVLLRHGHRAGAAHRRRERPRRASRSDRSTARSSRSSNSSGRCSRRSPRSCRAARCRSWPRKGPRRRPTGQAPPPPPARKERPTRRKPPCASRRWPTRASRRCSTSSPPRSRTSRRCQSGLRACGILDARIACIRDGIAIRD